MRKNRRLVLSCIFSLLLHFLIIAILFTIKPKSQPALKKVNLENLLVLKRGQSQDPSQNTPGARKPSLAAMPSHPAPPSNSSPPSSIPPKQQKQIDSKKKSLDSYSSTPFDPQNLSLLNPSTSSQQSSTQAKETDRGSDPQTIREIDELYGEEFGDLGTAQKNFIKNNLRNIGRITQSYLSYPRIAAYFEQSGVNAVEFTLHPNGDITDLRIIKSSGLSSFDSQTLHTIRIAYKDYPRPSQPTPIRIHVTYSYFGR